jgi:hypothetical protein
MSEDSRQQERCDVAKRVVSLGPEEALPSAQSSAGRGPALSTGPALLVASGHRAFPAGFRCISVTGIFGMSALKTHIPLRQSYARRGYFEYVRLSRVHSDGT